MRRPREELIDHLLGELAPDRSEAVEAQLEHDADLRAEFELLREARDLVREVAAEGWPARRRGRGRLIRIVTAAAAVIALAVGTMFLNGDMDVRSSYYEPDVALGFLRGEETDSAGSVRGALGSETAKGYRVRHGNVVVAKAGSDEEFTLSAGALIAPNSEVSVAGEGGARIDLPGGGTLFLGPLSTILLRERDDGAPALRLMTGVAATVPNAKPVHLAVDRTDLLVTQSSGAMIARQSPGEVVNLRGGVVLETNGAQFPVPVLHRLPASCAAAPETVPVCDLDLELDWYRELTYSRYESRDIKWQSSGDGHAHAELSKSNAGALLYLRLEPTENGDLIVRFGETGESYTEMVFPVRKGMMFRYRAPVPDGATRVDLSFPGAPRMIREARVVSATPR